MERGQQLQNCGSVTLQSSGLSWFWGIWPYFFCSKKLRTFNFSRVPNAALTIINHHVQEKFHVAGDVFVYVFHPLPVFDVDSRRPQDPSMLIVPPLLVIISHCQSLVAAPMNLSFRSIQSFVIFPYIPLLMDFFLLAGNDFHGNFNMDP